MEAEDRRFYSWLLISFGALGGMLGWLIVFTVVGLALILGGSLAVVAGMVVRLRPKTVVAGAVGITLAWWPLVVWWPLVALSSV